MPIQPPAVTFTKVDNNLTGIGFFTASSKRSRKAVEKTTVVMDQGIEHRISILPSAKYGLPITQDQDYWLALMKLVSEHVQREGKLTNPFTFTTAQLQHILGQSDAGKNYKSVEEWLSVMAFTGIEGGAYNVAQKTWLTEKTHTLDRVVTLGKKLSDGSIADKNYVWFSQWQLDNINAGNLIPIELATYNLLQNNIAKNLVPHLQEWLFASHRDGRFEKQYEDICQLLGIRVYRYRSQIDEQLSPSLNELVGHRYISKWAIESMANRKSYKLVLWHGSKYHNDQQTRLERKHRTRAIAAAGENPPRESRPRQQPLQLMPEVDARQLAALTGRGVSEMAARKILADLPAEFQTIDTLEWGDQQIATAQRGKFTNPPGFYISLLRDRITPPPTFETSGQKTARQEAELKQQESFAEQQARQLAYEAAAEANLNELQTFQPERYRALYEQARAELFAAHPNLAKLSAQHPNSSIHDGAIRARMKLQLAESSFSAPNFPAGNPPTISDENAASGTPFAATLAAILKTPKLGAPKKKSSG